MAESDSGPLARPVGLSLLDDAGSCPAPPFQRQRSWSRPRDRIKIGHPLLVPGNTTMPADDLGSASAGLAAGLTLIALFLGLRQWYERRARESDLSPADSVHFARQDMRRRAGVAVLVAIAVLALAGSQVAPRRRPGPRPVRNPLADRAGTDRRAARPGPGGPAGHPIVRPPAPPRDASPIDRSDSPRRPSGIFPSWGPRGWQAREPLNQAVP